MGEKERDEGGLGGYTITKSINISVIYSYLNSHSLINKIAYCLKKHSVILSDHGHTFHYECDTRSI